MVRTLLHFHSCALLSRVQAVPATGEAQGLPPREIDGLGVLGCAGLPTLVLLDPAGEIIRLDACENVAVDPEGRGA